jgi:hypothetical protein
MRYNRYHEGSEELYNHTSDPLCLSNLANDTAYADLKAALATHVPALPNAHICCCITGL